MGTQVLSSSSGGAEVVGDEDPVPSFNAKVSIGVALAVKEAMQDLVGESVVGDESTITSNYDDESGRVELSTVFDADSLSESASSISDADNDTRITVEASEDEDVVRIYVGGSEMVRVRKDGTLDVNGGKLNNAIINGGEF